MASGVRIVKSASEQSHKVRRNGLGRSNYFAIKAVEAEEMLQSAEEIDEAEKKRVVAEKVRAYQNKVLMEAKERAEKRGRMQSAKLARFLFYYFNALCVRSNEGKSPVATYDHTVANAIKIYERIENIKSSDLSLVQSPSPFSKPGGIPNTITRFNETLTEVHKQKLMDYGSMPAEKEDKVKLDAFGRPMRQIKSHSSLFTTCMSSF